MRNLVVFLFVIPNLFFANNIKVPSKIKEVTVYLSGAEITRTAQLNLREGTNKIIFTGLSHKIDESSIQVSGLNGVSIVSMAYDIDYLDKSVSDPQLQAWQDQLKKLDYEITLLKNTIYGLEEEEKVITTNRMVSADNQVLNLEKVKEISGYYRERLTAIKNEIFETNLKIEDLKKKVRDLQLQVAEVNNAPEKEQGEITIKFDVPVKINLKLTLKYLVSDAGWVPNYDIKSTGLNTPLQLAYKANVYQNTGKNWTDVHVVLSTGNPSYNISKPQLEAHYLNFTSAYSKRYSRIKTKKGYVFNPAIKKVAGTITDGSGLPLPGVSIIIKGTKHGTQTDFDGHYELEVPFGQELSFSYIGMHTQEVPLYSSIINLSMEEDVAALDEVVVSGYGSSSASQATGAVSSIRTERLLRGRTAGVNIRGISPIKRNQDQPLYIVDGIVREGFVEGDLDASEIQSVDILKSAEASSLYGSRGISGVVLITTKKSETIEGGTKTEFTIKKTQTIAADNDITAIEINTFRLPATYEYFAVPVIDENVYLTASFDDWEKHQLLPGEANIYFEGTFAGKTVLDPYTTQQEIILSLGIDPNITVTRNQERNFKSKSFTGNNRILERIYILEAKNNKSMAVSLKLMDRIPKSENKDIRLYDILTNNAKLDDKKGLLTWKVNLEPKQSQKEEFSFKVKYPKGRYVSL